MCWISVTDRLPEFNDHCLVYIAEDATHISNRAGRARVFSAYRSPCYVGSNNHLPYEWREHGPHTWFAHDVTHWMPVPEAPRQ